MWTNENEVNEWLRRVREGLRTRGYYYDSQFCAETSDVEPFLNAAKLLGPLYFPSAAENRKPFIPTKPSSSAPSWRPFDRRQPIRWHNDFSTHPRRPELSLSWIKREDPVGPENGAWWVAASAALFAKLCRTREGKRFATDLLERTEPFGYRDAGSWRPFRVIVRGAHKSEQPTLRFYGPALEDGAWLRFGKVPERTREIVARIEGAADAVREVLPARTGALLIVHNGRSLHDRAPQTVTGPVESRRQALLCFVKQLHRPL